MKGSPIIYSDAEMAWLTANRTMVISDYHRAFCAAFDRDVSVQNLHGLRKRKGWKVGRAKGRTAGRHTKYSAAELDWLRANCTLELAAYQRAFIERFSRPDITQSKLHSLRKRMGWKTGRTGRFEKGRENPNKGKPCPPGKGGRHPNAKATQFRKGQRSGRANVNYKPIGAERQHPNGYRERKIHDGLPMQSRWRFIHLIEWEAIHGPLPEGHCLKCLNGDPSNTDPSNWTLVSRGVLPRLNGGMATRTVAYHDAPPDLKPSVLALAQIEQRAHDLRRKARRAV